MLLIVRSTKVLYSFFAFVFGARPFVDLLNNSLFFSSFLKCPLNSFTPFRMKFIYFIVSGSDLFIFWMLFCIWPPTKEENVYQFVLRLHSITRNFYDTYRNTALNNYLINNCIHSVLFNRMTFRKFEPFFNWETEFHNGNIDSYEFIADPLKTVFWYCVSSGWIVMKTLVWMKWIISEY